MDESVIMSHLESPHAVTEMFAMSTNQGQSRKRDQAARLITGSCLIAADVDKTLLEQQRDTEKERFLGEMSPLLIKAARVGTNLAIITGNSMNELCSRLLSWLVQDMARLGSTHLLKQFHFFCNAGGVYARFQGPCLEHDHRPARRDEVWKKLTKSENDQHIIRPQYIDSSYIQRTRIPHSDIPLLEQILEEAAYHYTGILHSRGSELQENYNLNMLVDGEGKPIPVHIEKRSVEYLDGKRRQTDTVQLTLKPILSWRHARHPEKEYGKDLRSSLTQSIQDKLDTAGLAHYRVRSGGRSSIDLTLEKLDKAYALEFLIDRLNIQGHVHLGQKYGSNAIYLGDEVIAGGGNDYPVTRIPGLLVLAVNPDKELVPFMSHILMPSAIFEGPAVSADVLQEFNRIASIRLQEYMKSEATPTERVKTALDSLKEQWFVKRITDKIAHAADLDWGASDQRPSTEDLQTLHAFVTLVFRRDPAARRWLSILVKELDEIMSFLATTGTLHPPAGASHPD